MSDSRPARRWIVEALKLVVGGTLIAWLMTSGRLDFSPLLEESASPLHLVGFSLLVTGFILQVLRWRRLLEIQKISATLRQALSWFWIGEFFALVLPGTLGGELARGFYIVRSTGRARLAALSTVAVDRALGLFAILFLGTVTAAVLLLGETPSSASQSGVSATVTLLLLAMCAALIGVAFPPSRRILMRLVPKRFLASVESLLDDYLTRKKLLVWCFVLSLMAHLLLMTAFMVAGRILGTPLLWYQVLLAVPLVLIALVLPLSPGGIGVGETAASVLFAQFGVENGAAIMLIVRVWLVVVQLSGGLVYLFHRPPSEHFRS